MNILFLTSATGGGHFMAARALMEYMEKQIPGCSTRIVDALKYINPLVDKLITGTYLSTVRRLPDIYGKLYDLSERGETITDVVKGFNSILSRGLSHLFEQNTPDAVICTHTMPLQMMACLKRKGLNIPVLGIVTDYTHHSFWKLKEIDAFIVGHDSIREDMMRMGLGEYCVHALGIPVSRRFTSPSLEKGFALNQLGLENKTTVLIMGGSLGIGNMTKTFEALLAIPRNIQILAVTGHNGALKQQLEGMAEKSDKNIRILGFTDRVCELMEASSLIITKPGGITISEALVKRLPILLMDPIPGQEERNAAFLSRSGAAFQLPSHNGLESVLEFLLDRPKVLEGMSESAARLAKPRACEDISCLVQRLVSRQPELFYIQRTVI